MIGQKKLISKIEDQIKNNRFPSFALFVAEDGFGKKTLMKKISKHWKYQYICEDVKVATIREMIYDAYKTTKEGQCVYIIPDAHKMSQQARNAILKIVEEPPTYATFLMSVNSEDNVLGTIRSRAMLYRMDRYSCEELEEYLSRCQDVQDKDFILSVSDSISDIQKALRIDPGAIRKHINSIIDKADVISYGNLFKSRESLNVDGKEDKFDLSMYWKAFCLVCLRRMRDTDKKEDKLMYKEMIEDTQSTMDDMRIASISKPMLYDRWIISIRDTKERFT